MVRRTKTQIQEDNAKLEKIETVLRNASEKQVREFFIPLIMERQTDSEKVNKTTSQNNNIGLSGAHAPTITEYYNNIVHGLPLMDWQVEESKKILIHYRKQYLEILREHITLP